MKKPNRKVPQSVKTNRKIDAAVREALQYQSLRYAKAAQGKNHQHEQHIQQLKQSFVSPVLVEQNLSKSLLPVVDPDNGVFIPNAKQGWKLFSNIAFASIIATNAFFVNLDPEIVAALPENIQYYITIIQAFVGIGARMINQTKRKQGVADV